MIYAATQWSIKQTDQGKTKRLVQFFSNSLKDSDALKNAENKEDYCYYKVSDGTHSYNFAKYLEIRRTNKEQVIFHNLYKNRNLFSDEMQKIFPGMDDSSEAIYSQSADKMDKIEYNTVKRPSEKRD